MEVNETGELVTCQVIQAEFPFLPGPSSVSWAVWDWVPAKVMSVSGTRSFYNRLLKPLLMWCPTLFLIFHLDEDWPREKLDSLCDTEESLPQPMNTHWNFEWERDLHWTDLFYILGLFFFLKQLLLPSLMYLFYGKHHLHSSNCILRTTFTRLKSNVLWKHPTSLLKLEWGSLRVFELNLQEIC